jgi:hypothetical protein
MGNHRALIAKENLCNKKDGSHGQLTFNKLGNVLADEGNALAVRVSTDGTDLVEKLLCSRKNVFREQTRSKRNKLRPFRESSNLNEGWEWLPSRKKNNTHLSIERDRRLIQAFLLRIPNVGTDHLLEWQVVAALFEFDAIFFSFDRELAAYSVLDLQEGGV